LDPNLAKVFKRFNLKELECFTAEELRFLLKVAEFRRAQDVDISIVDYFRMKLKVLISKGSSAILKSHAETMLKALDFWDTFHDDKFLVWKEDLKKAKSAGFERARQSLLSVRSSASQSQTTTHRYFLRPRSRWGYNEGNGVN